MLRHSSETNPIKSALKSPRGSHTGTLEGVFGLAGGGGRSRTLAILPDSLHVVGGMNKHLVFTHLFTLSIGSS